MSTYGYVRVGVARSKSPSIKTLVDLENLRAGVAERMRTGLTRRARISLDAQMLIDKINKYWRNTGYQPPVLWVENDSNSPELPGHIRSNMIGGLPQVKLHD